MQNDTISYTQHTGEVFARRVGGTARAEAPVGTGEGSHVDVFVGRRENRVASTQTSGRSMIEMLGVLAIIGVLSVGALSGYRMAMTKYRANEVVDYAMRVAEGALHHGYTQKTGDIPNEGNDACKSYVNGEAAPFDMNCWIANGETTVPLTYFFLGGGSYSVDLGTAIAKQIEVCDGYTYLPCAYTMTSCSAWVTNLAGQPCIRFNFKR